MRVTNNMISQRVLANLQRNFQSVARLQDILSGGRLFRLPEDNPTAYVESLNLRQELSANRRFVRNIHRGLNDLQMAESTLSFVNDRLQRARTLALQSANAPLDEQARQGIAVEIDQIFDDLVSLANSSFEGRFIFSGDRTLTQPFEVATDPDVGRRVVYRGDFGDRLIEISKDDLVPINLTGPQAFFTSLNEVTSSVAVDPTTLLEPQLTGVVDPPVTLVAGDFTVNGVSITFDPATDTLESLRDSINSNVDDADARITSDGRLIIRSLTSTDVELSNGTSNVLEALDLFYRVEGDPIGAAITPATTLAGLGIIGDAIAITVGEDVFQIDLASAATVGDVIAAVSSSGAPVEAFINGAGTGLTFSATRSVDSLEIRSLRKIFASSSLAPGSVTSDTTLASLGITPGVITVSNDGLPENIDLTAATTVGDVLTALNQINGVTAAINSDGTGIDLESAFFSSSLSVSDVGTSTIATVLGFAQTRSSDNAADFGVTVPGEVDEVESNNLFLTLALFRRELDNPESDPQEIDNVLNRLDRDLALILENRSTLGARINRLQSTSDRLGVFETFLTELLSRNEDADLAETITELNTQTNVLTAALNSGSRLIQPSLLDFLR